ncbi:MAG: hypothetical protein CL927_20170 [Deltaproteobacteria bacterium]|nr:hypothetical protein [Deltaproteobacteria bacterium]HCH64056.1 hypothetical protein [Deltaproteobacteria bacterium]
MSQALQGAIVLRLAGRRVFGTVWRVIGQEILVTSRDQIAPDSHAVLEWELERAESSHMDVVRADVVVRHATGEGESIPGPFRYMIELRVMSLEHKNILSKWLAARQSSAEVDPDEPTEMVFRDLSLTLDTLLDDRPTDPPSDRWGMARPVSSRRTRPAVLSSISTRNVRSSRAVINVDGPGARILLTWRSWSDLEADWVATLSYGALYVRPAALALGSTCVVVACMPDGRKALLSGRVGSRVRGVTCIALSMGEQTRMLFTQRFSTARSPEVAALR